MKTSNDFVFNLQLLNDAPGGEVGDSSTDEVNANNPVDLPSGGIGLKDGQLHFIDEEDPSEGNEDFSDDDGARNVDGNNPETTEPEQVPQVQQPQQQQPLQTEIPPQQQPPTQQPPVQQPEVSQQPQQQPQQQVDVTTQIAEVAQKLVEQKFGEEFDQFDTRHMAEYTMNVSRIEREANEYMAVQQRQQAEQKQVAEVFYTSLQEIQAQDKENFAEIDKLSQSYMQTMPYGKAKPVIDAVERLNTGKGTLQDVNTMKSYWEVCRSEYYAKKTGISRQAKPINPPHLETPGQGDTDIKESFDPKKLGKMTQDERIAFYKQSGFAEDLLNL